MLPPPPPTEGLGTLTIEVDKTKDNLEDLLNRIRACLLARRSAARRAVHSRPLTALAVRRPC